MTVEDDLAVEGAEVYYDPDFRRVIEDHLEYLYTHASTRTLTVSAGSAYHFEFDLTGYLTSLGIAPYMHWIILRVNGFKHDFQFDTNCTALKVPADSVIEILRQRFVLRHTI